MKIKNFEVRIYYSGFCTRRIKARTECEAITKARRFGIKENEVLNSLENWEEADTAEEIEKYGKKDK